MFSPKNGQSGQSIIEYALILVLVATTLVTILSLGIPFWVILVAIIIGMVIIFIGVKVLPYITSDLIEYAMILTLVGVVTLVVIALLGPAIANAYPMFANFYESLSSQIVKNADVLGFLIVVGFIFWIVSRIRNRKI